MAMNTFTNIATSGMSGTSGIGPLNLGVSGGMKSLQKPAPATGVGGVAKSTAVLPTSTTPSFGSVVNTVTSTVPSLAPKPLATVSKPAATVPTASPVVPSLAPKPLPAGPPTVPSFLPKPVGSTISPIISEPVISYGGPGGANYGPVKPMGNREAQHPVTGRTYGPGNPEMTEEELANKKYNEDLYAKRIAAENPVSAVDADPQFFQDPGNKFYNDAATWQKAGMDMTTRKPIVSETPPSPALGVGTKPQLTPLWEGGPTDPDKMTPAEIQRYLTLQDARMAANVAAAQPGVKKI
jgi:hypothetical protein